MFNLRIFLSSLFTICLSSNIFAAEEKSPQFSELKEHLKKAVQVSLNSGSEFVLDYPQFVETASAQIEAAFAGAEDAPSKEQIEAYLEAKVVHTLTSFSFWAFKALLLPDTEVLEIRKLKSLDIAQKPIAYTEHLLAADKRIAASEIEYFLDHLVVFIFKSSESVEMRVLGAHRKLTSDPAKLRALDRRFSSKPLRSAAGEKIGDTELPIALEFPTQPKVHNTKAFIESFLEEMFGVNQLIFLDEMLLAPKSEVGTRRSETVVMNELQHAMEYYFLEAPRADSSEPYIERDEEIRSFQAEVLFLRDVYKMDFEQIVNDTVHRYSAQDLNQEAESIQNFDFQFPPHLLEKLKEAFDGKWLGGTLYSEEI